MQVETVSVNGNVVDPLVGDALEIQSHDDGDVRGDLDENYDHGTPPEDALQAHALGNEDSTPLDEDRDLEEWQDEGVADAEDEHPLDRCWLGS